MDAIVYYFTGTGNSLAVAKDVACRMNAALAAISEVIENDTVKTNEDTIGIVFPVYHQGIPSIIKRFIAKHDTLKDKYIFGICTYGDSPGISLEYLEKCIKAKEGKLCAGYAVKMPYNYVTPALTLKNFFSSFKLREIEFEKQQKMFENWERRLKSIQKDLEARKQSKVETHARSVEKLVDMLNLRNTLQKAVWLKIAGFKGNSNTSFEESIKRMDNGFWSDKSCNSCGICSKVCPVRNIVMLEGKPVWQHRCEQCFACLQWCPKQAVQFREGTINGKRYHHPRVRLSDLLGKH